ncbi:MAG TPA: hypothetical protein VKP13_09755, partial [Nitrospira sp.]|nr:hypothetical protein [Nitrospira sp.]
ERFLDRAGELCSKSLYLVAVMPGYKENEFVTSDPGKFGTSAHAIAKAIGEVFNYLVTDQVAE